MSLLEGLLTFLLRIIHVLYYYTYIAYIIARYKLHNAAYGRRAALTGTELHHPVPQRNETQVFQDSCSNPPPAIQRTQLN